MTPWREGDPVGMGQVYLPDTKTRRAYAKACSELWVEPAARRAISLPTLWQRREFIAKYSGDAQELLKSRIKELWAEK